jgi:aryl-alcohol dehydrogenase-like predicted oxidoreductase
VIRGFATDAATRAWARRHPALTFTPLGRTGLACSRAGFGGYRIGTAEGAHRDALVLALRSGINLIDTSANYADGQSEALVGAVLAQLIGAGEMVREAVTVVTKAGYLQGQNFALSQERRQRGRPFPELVPYGEGLEHCIHPEFLEDQITRSLTRLGLATIDVLLLHNPEYYLGWAARQGTATAEARRVYMDRIRRACDHLEREVARGRIRWYGVSSNTFPAAAERADFTSLTHVVACAQEARDDHHLAVVQFPMNLFESGAVCEGNQPDGRSLLDAVRRFELGALVNRPLNAFADDRLLRLAEVPDPAPVPPEAIEARLQALAASENEILEVILPSLDLDPQVASQIARQLAMAAALEKHYAQYATYANWQQIRDEHILPRAGGVLAYLERQAAPAAPAAWHTTYRRRLAAALDAIGAHYAPAAAGRVRQIKEALRASDADWAVEGTLSRMALRALAGTRGIASVLVGMRREDYVQDVCAALKPPLPVKDRAASWMQLRDRLAVLHARA